MIEENPPADDRPVTGTAGIADDVSDDSIGGRLSRLVDSARSYADAELDRQKVRAGLVAVAIRQVAILIGMAAMLTFATTLALMVGLILALQDVVGGPGVATVIVIVGALLIAVGLILVAKAKIVALKEALKP